MWKTTTYNTTKLTVELREIVESGVDIWDFDYPSYYKGTEKTAFEKKVIDHYYFRQIGQETVGRFLHVFRTKIQEIMPYYVELYKTKEIMAGIEDPFGNVDITETFSQTTTGSNSENSTGSTDTTVNGNVESISTGTDNHSIENLKKFSDTPQSSANSVNQGYLTNVTSDTGSDKRNLSNTSETTDYNESLTTHSIANTGTNETTIEHTFTKKGNQGVNTYAHDMIEFRKSIIDVDMMIITALNECFLGVY